MRAINALTAVLLAITSALSFAPFFRLRAQLPLLSGTTKSPEARNFSVGFSLQSSYGAAAVIFDGADGEREIVTRVVYGDSDYQSVMARLSLETSRHLAPPYDGEDQYWADYPRKMARLFNKKAGLPASADVGTLANVIKTLRSQLEADLNIRISSAILTVAHLVALYQDDAQDIFEYVGIEYIEPKNQFRPLLWETAAAYAGYGLGICEHYHDKDICENEEQSLPRVSVFAVHYSRTALTTALVFLWQATALWEPDYRHLENFNLGSDAMARYASPDEYWRDVNGTLEKLIDLWQFPQMVILTGDMVQGELIDVVQAVLYDRLKKTLPVYSDDATVVAAKGAAELKRRLAY